MASGETVEGPAGGPPAKALAEAGGDPVAAKRPAPPPPPVVVWTVQQAYDGFIAARSPEWDSRKTEALARSSAARHAAALMLLPVASVTLADVAAALEPIWLTRTETATKLRGHLEGAFEYAAAQGWRMEPNPALWRGGLRALLPAPSKVAPDVRNHPALPWSRVPSFLAILRGKDGTAARALELCVLTAVRSGEARLATWGEVDFAKGVWTIPAARTKTKKKPHRVPLAPQVADLLRDLLPTDGMEPNAAALLFPNRKGEALSDMALLKVITDLHEAAQANDEPGWTDAAGERITPHGFRSSFRDWCAETERSRDLAEISLGHAVGSAVERSYRRSDLLALRLALMNDWAAHCTGGAPPTPAPDDEGTWVEPEDQVPRDDTPDDAMREHEDEQAAAAVVEFAPHLRAAGVVTSPRPEHLTSLRNRMAEAAFIVPPDQRQMKRLGLAIPAAGWGGDPAETRRIALADAAGVMAAGVQIGRRPPQPIRAAKIKALDDAILALLAQPRRLGEQDKARDGRIAQAVGASASKVARVRKKSKPV